MWGLGLLPWALLGLLLPLAVAWTVKALTSLHVDFHLACTQCVQVLLTPLHYAASLGEAACVAALLQHGADIHMLDQVRHGALCCCWNHLGVSRISYR